MIQMWSDMGCDIPIEEGVYWLDNGIIKTIEKDSGKLLPLYKYSIFDDLTIDIKLHKDYSKNKDKDFETWNKTTTRLSSHLDKIEKESISLLLNHGSNMNRTIVNLNSTGKDSMVLLRLSEKSDIKFKTYFNVTTLDVGESNRMARKLGFEFIKPKPPHSSFYKYINYSNVIPSRLNRCCCTYFKENPTIDYFDDNEKLLFLLGMRNSESNARSGYTDVWRNEKWGNRDWVGVLPIRKWSDLDVWLYILREGIQINPKYKMGYARVGCAIACPNYSKSTWVLDKYWYSKMYNRWQDILREDFIKHNKWLIMNCTIDEYCKRFWNGGVAYGEPSNDVIKEYALHNEIDFEVAKKYFNRHCMNGCSRQGKLIKIKDKEVLAMNMKMLGRNLEKFQCKKCLMKYLGFTKEEWREKAKQFKESGCKLF